MKNAKLFKEKVKRWHDKRIQKREFKVGNMFFCTTLISDSLQENSSPNGKDPMLSRRFIGLEL